MSFLIGGIYIHTVAIYVLTNAANILVYGPSYSTSHVMSNARIAETLANAGHNVVSFKTNSLI